MVGVYNYTVWLTYLSLISGALGSFFAMTGRPYVATICLMASGVLDAFDGRVARTKKDRTDYEKAFGIQIDSLTDIVSFGVLPAAIGAGLVHQRHTASVWLEVLLFAFLAFYVLTAMIRLAHFNCTTEDMVGPDGKTYYTGLPVTASALVSPLIMLIQYLKGIDLTMVYCVAVFILGLAFISPFKIKKPGITGILIMIGIGLIIVLAFVAERVIFG